MKPTDEFHARFWGIDISGKGHGVLVALAALVAVLVVVVLLRPERSSPSGQLQTGGVVSASSPKTT